MSSRAVTLHAYKNDKTTGTKTAGGTSGKKLIVSPSSGEVVTRSKRLQGLRSTWARDTEFWRGKLGLTGKMVLFNVGADGKKLYKYVTKSKECRVKLGTKDSVTIDGGAEGKKLFMCASK